MEENPNKLEIYELRYSDLFLLSTHCHSSSSLQGNERIESITKSIFEALGPSGPGLLAITGVPNSSVLRRTLLPLARKLALLNPDDRKRILKDHNLGSDVPLRNPERSVSSFAMQLKYTESKEFMQNNQSQRGDKQSPGSEIDHFCDSIEKEVQDNEFKHLGDSFKELGSCMLELGLHIARICDAQIGGQELEQSLLESCTAKGRLIHYHSALDAQLLRKSTNCKGTARNQANSRRNKEQSIHSRQEPSDSNGLCQSITNLWQQWHYDYGIFTVLTTPMFLSPSNTHGNEAQDLCCYSECCSPSGHLYLQIFDPCKNDIFMVNAPPESFIIQVGESSDIISRGKLRSTLHSVCRPSKHEDLCREMFVVFLQPAWNKTFSMSDYSIESSTLSEDKRDLVEQEATVITREIQKIVPPLASRLKEGMTFAEFSRETTKQYYGGNGLQSNR
ncbi:uncharacterized protein LOC111460876 [Cucurbita moschata]|uniref:Uncharacterized protein LOC111460876 n=1 Tax=Cucurbita moschata TaxID=3662 RepID=A0A6J1H636_CUCMO|nr:uncharacterized protein LOC111460876 [Cucurbita moschata]